MPLVGLYAGGSLGSGDYVPGISDLDLVAIIGAPLAGGRLISRPLSGIGRAELLRFGITIHGPAPAEVFPPVDATALRAAARAELTGFWSSAAARRRNWLRTDFVDMGLITIARAHATVTEGRLITKAEAIGRLGHHGVPDRLAGEMAQRRAGR